MTCRAGGDTVCRICCNSRQAWRLELGTSAEPSVSLASTSGSSPCQGHGPHKQGFVLVGTLPSPEAHLRMRALVAHKQTRTYNTTAKAVRGRGGRALGRRPATPPQGFAIKNKALLDIV
eukprot:356542-Chlamydomonas_euryale.AAC.4